MLKSGTMECIKMEETKILHANDDNYNLGGAFILTYRVEKYLRKFGFSYDYITMDHFCADSEQYAIDSNDKTYSANLRKNKFIGHVLLPLYVDRILKRENYKIIHIDTDSAWKALLYAIPARKNGIQVLVHSHSTGIDGKCKGIKSFCEFGAKRILTHYCNVYVACSEDAAKWIVPPKSNINVKVIPNGIELKDFYYDSFERKEYREIYNLGKSIVLGNVGLLTENKNQEYLIEMLEYLLAKKYNVKLLLVGKDDTSYGEKLKNVVKQKGLEAEVIFTGVTSNVRQLMNAMDIYIQPSIFEGFGLVSVEAQATGLMTFVSESLPKESVICNWAQRFNLVSEKNVIERAVCGYIFDEDARANKIVDKKYGIEYMAEQEVDIYKSLMYK